MTPEENLIWENLKGKKMHNVHFRRQHPINIYIVDFYCHEIKLAVELDGKIHLKHKEYDNERSNDIEGYKITLIRFTNEEVNLKLDAVLTTISRTVQLLLQKKQDERFNQFPFPFPKR